MDVFLSISSKFWKKLRRVIAEVIGNIKSLKNFHQKNLDHKRRDRETGRRRGKLVMTHDDLFYPTACDPAHPVNFFKMVRIASR